MPRNLAGCAGNTRSPDYLSMRPLRVAMVSGTTPDIACNTEVLGGACIAPRPFVGAADVKISRGYRPRIPHACLRRGLRHGAVCDENFSAAARRFARRHLRRQRRGGFER